MPFFSVTIATTGENENVIVVVPEFNEEPGAFVSLVSENLTQNSSYYWKELNLQSKSKQTLKVNEGSRYINALIPFFPDRDTMESRVIFIKKGNYLWHMQ